MGKPRPGERHWHLGPIGVHPDLQGRDIGKAMLAAFLDMADDQGAPAYLETDVDRNVALYERFGFKVIAQEGIAGVDNRFMWRERLLVHLYRIALDPLVSDRNTRFAIHLPYG